MIPSTNHDCNVDNLNHVRPLFDGHDARTTYLLQHLLRQRVPSALDGGREILWFCPFCRKPWYEAGRSSSFVCLSKAQLGPIAHRLHADLDHVSCLPEAICPLCAAVYLGGKPRIEEYRNRRGYQFSWEAARPDQDHFFCLVYSWDTGFPHGPLEEAFSATSDVLTTPFSQMRVLLSWLAALAEPAREQALPVTLNTTHYPSGWNPERPGESRYGYCWKTQCPLLGDVLLLLGGTFPSTLAACSLSMLLECWRQIAGIMEWVL